MDDILLPPRGNSVKLMFKSKMPMHSIGFQEMKIDKLRELSAMVCASGSVKHDGN